MSIWALQFLEDYKKVHNKLKVKMKRAKARWSCPPSGRLKLNVDGAFLEDQRVGGIGVVARDEHGVCLVALSPHMPYAQPAMHMEAEALRASLLIAFYRGWNEIEIESDCETLLQALAKDGDVVEVSAILVDCRHYLMAFDYVLLRHVNREANGVANRLAHLARSSAFDELWEDSPPDIIQDVLIEDGCKFSQGISVMSPLMYDHSLNIDNNMSGTANTLT
ncbi:hypothetical protein ACLB2K_029356 [Fragaria x ananassa]